MTQSAQSTSPILFRGMHSKALDGKNRVGIPKPYRDLMGDAKDVVLVRGLDKDRFLEIWPTDAWERFVEQILALDGAAKKKTLMRGYVSQAIECKLDGQGRIVVPPYYREYAGMDGEVLWIGSGNMLELWAKDRFEQQDDALREAAYQVFIDNEDQFND